MYKLNSIFFLLTITLIFTVGGQEKKSDTSSFFDKGFLLQREGKSELAIKAYIKSIKNDPLCSKCYYELGWSYWSLNQWNNVIASWNKALTLDPLNEDLKTWLPLAKEKISDKSKHKKSGLHVPIGIVSKPTISAVQLTLLRKYQHYNPKPSNSNDIYDRNICSPKSIRFSVDGKKAYINSLEGFVTSVYDTKNYNKTSIIWHKFNDLNDSLFMSMYSVFDYKFINKPSSNKVNHFNGKPVESELTHNGKYLWIPYYRRDYDTWATSPSAVAIIDTKADRIVRVIPTGPIPKYIVASADNKYLAIIHWGDNTIAIMDISSNNPSKFKYLPKRLFVEKILPQTGFEGKNRDKSCGYCLRGAVFTNDGKYLIVARMGGGGIAGFDMENQTYLGTVLGMKPTPRHLVVSKDGKTLFISSNISGYVSKIPMNSIINTLKRAKGKRLNIGGWKEVHVGVGARTIVLSPDEKYIYSAVNSKSEIAVIDAKSMKVISRIRTDSYTVGLAISPDGTQLWSTSQGRKGRGGNSVCIYKVQYKDDLPPPTVNN